MIEIEMLCATNTCTVYQNSKRKTLPGPSEEIELTAL